MITPKRLSYEATKAGKITNLLQMLVCYPLAQNLLSRTTRSTATKKDYAHRPKKGADCQSTGKVNVEYYELSN